MKKLLILTLCLITIISLVSCDKTSDPGRGMKAADAPSGYTAELTSRAYIGKVTAVTGNEVAIDLAELPEDQNAASVPEEGSEGADSVDSVAAVPAGPVLGQSGPASQRPKIELKYTGESKNVVIPAGATIIDVQTGKEVKMTNIKEGSVVEMFYTQDGVITSVNIME